MTVHINPGYAKRIFDELPGRTRSEKADALSALIALLRAERDNFAAPVRRPREMDELLPSITGKTLSELASINVFVDGLSVPVTTLMNAYRMPGNALHDLAHQTFSAAGLTVVVEDRKKHQRRPVTRLVNRAQAALAKAVASRENLEANMRNAATAGTRPPWFNAQSVTEKGGDA